MMHQQIGKRTLVAALGMLSLLLAANATAQPRWGRPSTPRSGACFYQDTDFEGEYFCVPAGDVEVRIFQGIRFEGRSERFDRNIRNLGREGWNDRLSSLRIRDRRDDYSDRRNNDRGGNDRGNNDRANVGGGRREDPDVIVRRAYQDILNRDPDAAGLRIYRSHIIDDRWSETQVRDALRSSPEFRELTTMTRPKAEAIVARAYRSMLGRDPDPASAAFVDKVLRDKWTEEDVAAELRKSAEYRNKKK